MGQVDSNLYQPSYVPEPVFLGGPAIAARFDNLALQSHAKLSSIALADEISLLDERLILMAGVRRQGVDVGNFAQAKQTAERRSWQNSCRCPRPWTSKQSARCRSAGLGALPRHAFYPLEKSTLPAIVLPQWPTTDVPPRRSPD